MQNKIKIWFDSGYFSNDIGLLITSVIVGALTAGGAIIFIALLQKFAELTTKATDLWGGIGLLLVMGGGGLIVGFLIDRWAKEAKGHGVPEVMEAVALRGGRIRGQVAAIKVLASSITIGVGGSAGREGPIVQVGAALGSALGRRLRFSDEHTETLVACGAAAGISATFNAPISGALFALEVILGRFGVRHFGAIVISSVTASILSRSWLGNKPAFQIPAYPLSHLGELPLYFILSILAAFWAVLFIKLLYKMEDFTDHLDVPLYLKTAVGMLLTGSLALLLKQPEILGSGIHLIGETIAEDFNLTISLMLVLLVGKLFATTFTLGTGNSGGVFAPALYMGAVLGGMIGTIGHQIAPEIVVHPGAFAIVGMAAVFAGAARAPITAILIVFEMSGDYQLILPLMMATVLSTVIAEKLFSESIYTLKLKLKGINWQGGRDQDILQGVSVNEVMKRQDLNHVRTETPINVLADIFSHSHYNGLTVLTPENELWGIVTITDLERAREEQLDPETPISAIGTSWPQLQIAYPDEPIGDALQRMGKRGIGRLPVVDRENKLKLVGLIRRQDIIRAYDLALTKRADIQSRTERLHDLQQQTETGFIDFYLNEEATAVGKSLASLAAQLPPNCVLISIERNGKLIIPHGNAIFQTGDHITAFITEQAKKPLLAVFQ